MVSKEVWGGNGVWCCISAHTKTREQLNEFADEIALKLGELKENGKVEKCFFMRYTNEEIYLQIGLKAPDDLAKTQIIEIIKSFRSKGYIIERKEHDYTEPCSADIRPINGVECAELKGIAFEFYEMLSDNIEKININHLAYTFHFLANQSSFVYKEEIKIYYYIIEQLRGELEKAGIDTIIPCLHNKEKEIKFIRKAKS